MARYGFLLEYKQVKTLKAKTFDKKHVFSSSLTNFPQSGLVLACFFLNFIKMYFWYKKELLLLKHVPKCQNFLYIVFHVLMSYFQVECERVLHVFFLCLKLLLIYLVIGHLDLPALKDVCVFHGCQNCRMLYVVSSVLKIF